PRPAYLAKSKGGFGKAPAEGRDVGVDAGVARKPWHLRILGCAAQEICCAETVFLRGWRLDVICNRECLHEMMGSDVSILERKQKMGRIIASASLILFVSFGACGQVAPAPSVFEVASVRLNRTRI